MVGLRRQPEVGLQTTQMSAGIESRHLHPRLADFMCLHDEFVYSVAMSITNRYFTSLFSIRS